MINNAKSSAFALKVTPHQGEWTEFLPFLLLDLIMHFYMRRDTREQQLKCLCYVVMKMHFHNEKKMKCFILKIKSKNIGIL